MRSGSPWLAERLSWLPRGAGLARWGATAERRGRGRGLLVPQAAGEALPPLQVGPLDLAAPLTSGRARAPLRPVPGGIAPRPAGWGGCRILLQGCTGRAL